MRKFMLAVGCLLCLAAGPATQPARTVRVAAFGNINSHDLWTDLSAKFEKQTGIHVDTVTGRNKDQGPDTFRQGGIDLITMESESADAMIHLVADGYARDLRPWLQEDLAIVGPENDPARIKGMTDAAAALRKIVASKSPLVIHDSLGADQVIKTIVQADRGHLDPSAAIILLDDHQKHVLSVAMEKQAYTLIARLPFIGGKLEHPGYEVMVAHDPVLRRPVLAAIANPRLIAGVHTAEAEKFMQFLTSPETQEWIRTDGEKEIDIDEHAYFYPVAGAATQPTGAKGLLRVTGDLSKPLCLTVETLATLKHQTVKTKNRDGDDVEFKGVALRDILQLAGAPLGDHQMRGEALTMYVIVEAADGYRAVFALADFDEEVTDRVIVLADSKNGKPLDKTEGALRLLVPGEARPARAVRKVISIEVRRAG